VLVLLGRVLRVLNGAIRTFAKPRLSLGNVGVIRRALERDVQGDLQIQRLSPLNQGAKIFQRAQLWMHRLMPTLSSTDGPHAAWIIRLGRGSVVESLTKAAPDWMNGRQIQDI